MLPLQARIGSYLLCLLLCFLPRQYTMFYSETLLRKSGPLASVWLSATFEHKLSKKHILRSNIADSIAVIITPSQAPMALRLSSQLLLGVVRIHQRKTRYLLDDCDHTWVRMKMVYSILSSLPTSYNKMPRPSDQALSMIFLPADNFLNAKPSRFPIR